MKINEKQLRKIIRKSLLEATENQYSTYPKLDKEFMDSWGGNNKRSQEDAMWAAKNEFDYGNQEDADRNIEAYLNGEDVDNQTGDYWNNDDYHDFDPVDIDTRYSNYEDYSNPDEEELYEKINKIVSESINEIFGLSLDNRVKNGHWHENPKSKNPVIRTAYVNGWELAKPDEENIEGEYEARIMSGQFNNVDIDRSIKGVAHPKASWPMLIAMLNKELRPQGYTASGTNYREARLDLMDRETTDGYGAKTYMGTIIVRKA